MKPVLAVHRVAKTLAFPRSSERGPIEAAPYAAALFCDVVYFRAHRSAAPLKRARVHRCSYRRAYGFPRSSERGPIEAWAVRCLPRLSLYFRAHRSAAPLKLARYLEELKELLRHFRAHRSAAPLKRRSRHCALRDWSDFRAHRSAAPLKPERSSSLLPSVCYFRAHRSAAPLKLDYLPRRECPVEPLRISALIGARPH